MRLCMVIDKLFPTFQIVFLSLPVSIYKCGIIKYSINIGLYKNIIDVVQTVIRFNNNNII